MAVAPGAFHYTPQLQVERYRNGRASVINPFRGYSDRRSPQNGAGSAHGPAVVSGTKDEVTRVILSRRPHDDPRGHQPKHDEKPHPAYRRGASNTGDDQKSIWRPLILALHR